MFIVKYVKYIEDEMIDTVEEAVKIAEDKAQKNTGESFVIFEAIKIAKTTPLPIDVQPVELIEGETFTAKYLGKLSEEGTFRNLCFEDD